MSAPARQSLLEKSTGSPATLELVLQWLQKCIADHRDCGTTDGNVKSPTRVLELHEDGIRLLLAADMEKSPCYLTISHCWGNVERFKLMKDNLDMLRRGVPVHKLCKNFQDAIYITRQLGYKYLWIDSLCIIQDDEEDWRRESVLMATVYGHATLNLAASGAKDGSEGFFFDRKLVKVQRQYLRMPDNQLWELFDRKLYRRCVAQAPLSSRAWAFQERYLSRRTLHFTREQVFWECCHQLSCETYPDRLPPGLYGNNLKSLSKTPSTTARKIWAKLVSQYSNCQLTYARDKLVAISGVAHSIEAPELGQYLAGLWRTDLEEQLCWRVHSANAAQNYLEPKSVYRAPSWSWASVDFPVFLPHPSTSARLLAHVLVASTTPLGSDEYGEITDAKLQLECHPLLDANDILKRKGTTLFRTFHLTYERASHESCSPVWDDRSILSTVNIYWDSNNAPNEEAKEVYLVAISTAQPGPPHLVSCLLVTGSDRDGRGLFTRVGMCILHLEIPFEDFVLAVTQNSPESLADDSSYEAVSGADDYGIKKYVLTLV